MIEKQMMIAQRDRGAAWRDNGRDESYIDSERLDIELKKIKGNKFSRSHDKHVVGLSRG